MTPATEAGCFDPARLREVVTRGFAEVGQRARFLAHFGLECPVCKEYFLQWAVLPEPLEMPRVFELAAGEPGPLYDPPRRALLRRRADVPGGVGPGAKAPGEPLPFLRLLLDEARHASLGLPREAAVACVRRALDDLRLARHFLEQSEPPPGCRVTDRATFELMALEGRAREALAAELQTHGGHLQAEPLRRDAELVRLLSQAGLWLDDFHTGRDLGR